MPSDGMVSDPNGIFEVEATELVALVNLNHWQVQVAGTPVIGRDAPKRGQGSLRRDCQCG